MFLSCYCNSLVQAQDSWGRGVPQPRERKIAVLLHLTVSYTLLTYPSTATENNFSGQPPCIAVYHSTELVFLQPGI